MPYVFHGNFSFAMCLPNKTRDFASRGAQPKRSRPRFFSYPSRVLYESRRTLINGCPKRAFFFSRRHDGSIVIIIFHEPRAFIIDRWCQPASLEDLFIAVIHRSTIRYVYRFKIVCCKYSVASSLFSWIILNYRNNGKFVSKKWEGRSYYIGQVLRKNSKWYESTRYIHRTVENVFPFALEQVNIWDILIEHAWKQN